MKRKYSWVRPSEDAKLEKSLSHNAFVSIFCSFLNFTARFFLPPVILYYIPIEVYGIWSYCFILINYYGMSLIGLSNVYIRYTAIFAANNEQLNINKLISTGLICTTALGILTILATWYFIPYTFPILQIPENLYGTAFILLFGTIAIFTLEVTLGSFKHILHGLGKVGLQWAISTVSQLVESALIIILLFKGFGVFSLLYAYLTSVGLSAAAYIWACYRLIPNLSVRWKFFDTAVLHYFYRFGGIVQIRSMLSVINRTLPRLLSGIFMGARATALCDLGEKFPITVSSVVSSGLYVFLPASSHMHAKGEKEKIRSLYLFGTRYMSMLSGLMLGFLAPFSFVLVTAWLGADPQYQAVAWIIACFSLPYHVIILTGPASAAFRGINLPSKELWYGIGEILLALISGLMSVYFFGYQLVPLVASIGATFIITSGLYLIYTNYFFKVGQKEFFKFAVLPGLMPYLIGIAMILGINKMFEGLYSNRWEALYFLLGSLAVYGVIASAFFYIFLFTPKERQHLIAHYAHLVFKRLKTQSQPETFETSNLDSIGKASHVWHRVEKIYPVEANLREMAGKFRVK